MKLALSAELVATALTVPVIARAEVEHTAAEVALRVDVAGRQRMLSQRMAKAACLAARDVERDDAMAQLRSAFELFGRSDAALRDGDAALGLAPEPYDEVREALARIDPAWSVAQLIVGASLERGAIDGDALILLERASQELTGAMNEAVGVTARAHAENAEEVPLALALTVDVAGRQRMLSQRIVKAACLLDTEGGAAFRDQLAEAAALFDVSLRALRDGMPEAGILPPPTAEIEGRLAWVEQLWTGLKGDIELALAGETLDRVMLTQLAQRSEIVLSEMNAAVNLYGR